MSLYSFDSCQDVPRFARMELETAIKGLKNGRARDGAGVFAELLKTGGPTLVDVLLDLYSQAYQQVRATAVVEVFHGVSATQIW